MTTALRFVLLVVCPHFVAADRAGVVAAKPLLDAVAVIKMLHAEVMMAVRLPRCNDAESSLPGTASV